MELQHLEIFELIGIVIKQKLHENTFIFIRSKIESKDGLWLKFQARFWSVTTITCVQRKTVQSDQLRSVIIKSACNINNKCLYPSRHSAVWQRFVV